MKERAVVGLSEGRLRRARASGGPTAALACALAFHSSGAVADGDNVRHAVWNTAVVAATCVTCHAPSPEPGGIPSLNGLSAEHLLARLRGFKANGPAQTTAAMTIMPLLMQGYDEAQIRALADWFASRQASPR